MMQQNHPPIDVHAHIVPPTLIGEARRSGQALGVTVEDTDQGPALQFEGLDRLRPLEGNLVKIEPRIEWLDDQGLGMQIVASWLDIQGYSLKPDNAATWARLFNEHLAQIVTPFKDRFAGLATVPVQDGELAARELEYAVNSLGLLGTMLATDPVDQDLAKESFEPLWEAAEDLGVPVVLHPPTHGFGANIRPSYLGFSLGRTLDTTITATKLILEGLLDRHPRLKMVLVHGGGYLPYQAGRIDRLYEGGLNRPTELKRNKPSDYLPVLYYDTMAMSVQAIRLMRDIAGADHIMLGSDYIFSGPKEPLMAPVDQAGLEPDETALICCGTALRLFLNES